MGGGPLKLLWGNNTLVPEYSFFLKKKYSDLIIITTSDITNHNQGMRDAELKPT